jgi:hypothetical protein
MHLVNNKDLLEPGIFIKVTINESVKAGSSTLLIIRRGTRVIKRALSSESGPIIIDLILEDVIVIEGFHINIISEAQLLKSGV